MMSLSGSPISVNATRSTTKTCRQAGPTLVERLAKEKNEEFWVYPEKCETFIPGAQRREPYDQQGRTGGHHRPERILGK